MRPHTIILSIWAALAQCALCLDERQTSTSSNGPFFDRTTQQICGYVTEDVNAAYGCGDYYCTTISGYFACCETFDASNLTTTSSATWYYTESLTTSSTQSGLDVWTFIDTSYTYQTCGWYTTCYNYNVRPTTTNVADLICSDTVYAACQILTMSHAYPNATYTAFRCAEIALNQALYSTYTTPTGTAAAASASASTADASGTPASTVPTSVTQQSIPASAAATITTMPSPTGGATRQFISHCVLSLLPLLSIVLPAISRGSSLAM